MIKRKQRKGKDKVKTGRKLCISLFSVLLLATLATLVLLRVKQRCPELGLRNCLCATMITFRARKLESAILRGDTQLAREMMNGSARTMATFALSLPGEEPKVSTFDVPIGGIGRNRRDNLRGVAYHPNSTARDVGDLRCVVIFLHGGGWVVGSVFESSQRAKILAKASDLIVVALQYRLSPEYVFPSQLNDVQRGLRYVRRHAAEWGGDPECIAMAGESAGANLALTVGILSSPPQWWRRAPLCAIALSSPPLSYSHCSNREGTFKTFKKNHFLESSLMDVFWNAYLGPGKNGGNWRASPLHTPKSRLQKLRRTPVLFIVAEQEVLRDDIYEMHEKFLDMGIESTLTQYNGTVHGFFARGPPFDPGFQSVLQTGDFLKTHCRAKGQMNVMDVCTGNLCMGFVLGGRKCSVPSGCTGWRHSPTQRNLFGGGKKGDKKPGMGNMLDSLKKANEIGQKTQQLQKELQDVRITGVSANGKVKITMTGSQVPVSCEISEDAMPESTASLSASVTEAMGAAHKESLEKMTKRMTELYSDMGLPGIGQG